MCILTCRFEALTNAFSWITINFINVKFVHFLPFPRLVSNITAKSMYLLILACMISQILSTDHSIKDPLIKRDAYVWIFVF